MISSFPVCPYAVLLEAARLLAGEPARTALPGDGGFLLAALAHAAGVRARLWASPFPPELTGEEAAQAGVALSAAEILAAHLGVDLGMRRPRDLRDRPALVAYCETVRRRLGTPGAGGLPGGRVRLVAALRGAVPPPSQDAAWPCGLEPLAYQLGDGRVVCATRCLPHGQAQERADAGLHVGDVQPWTVDLCFDDEDLRCDCCGGLLVRAPVPPDGDDE
ncbi:hypothetical protein [Streptosporangium sp. NPDC050280]|uniref:hypothetical protein n=1 Tax=unclassified Streptosporangium TaxID=2632669 RepID=UPI003423B0C6